MSVVIPSLRAAVTVPGWAKNALWRNARAVPSLDLRFADNKSLVDAVTGQQLVTFTRAGSGTFVDSAGVLQTAVTNLLLRSEEFDTAGTWGVLSVTVTANTQLAPNGTTSAETLTDVNGVTTANVGCFQSTTLADSTTYAMSCYVKAGTKTTCRVGIRAKDGTNILANFNLSAVSTTAGNTLSSTIQDAGNGWYRCTAICASATGATGPRGIVFMDTASYTADGTGTIHVWGAQLEQASSVGEYIPTTSVINSAPRFDHKPTTGESLGLLVEEARTNLLLQSNGFNTTWVNFNISSIAASGIAPDGTNTAWELKDTLDAVSTTHSVSQAVSVTGGIAYSVSVFLKAGTLPRMALILSGVTSFSSGNKTAVFNLTTGAIASTSGTTATSQITPYPNGWYRCTLTATADATAPATLTIRTENGTSTLYTGDGTGTILIWGAQLEAGAFSSSYIATTTAAATRAADLASITGSAFSSWYNQTEGAFFGEVFPAPTYVAFQAVATLHGAANVDEWRLWRSGATTQSSQITVNNITELSAGGAFTTATNGSYAFATAAAANDMAIALSGNLASDNAGAMAPVTSLRIGGRGNGTFFYNGHISRLVYWPQRLPNSTLQSITQ
jgi:hypothetical protein